MMNQSLFTELLRERHFRHRLFPIEMVTLAYAALTLLLVILFWGRMQSPLWLATQRLLIVTGVFVFYYLNKVRPCAVTRFLRHFLPICLLGFWYPDTYNFSCLWPNADHFFAEADLTLFGFQPALTFAHDYPQTIVREVMNLGYFSYFLMIAAGFILPLMSSRSMFEKTTFIIIASFLLFYVLYLFIPVVGPQFYFPAAGVENIQQNEFPHLDYYFATHTELLPSVAREGFFGSLVNFMQQGERPTAAFPSSHVGVATILLILFIRHHRTAAIIAAPFYVLLCLSTVYIHAHYLVDVFAGLAVGFLFYFFTRTLYDHLKGSSDYGHKRHHHHHHKSGKQ